MSKSLDNLSDLELCKLAHFGLGVRRRALASLIPPERLPLSAWIAASVRLPQGTTAVPGPMRLWPYQRAIADSIGNPEVERVTLCKAAGSGSLRF